MKGQLRQVFFLAVFGLLCTVFVFFVPWGSQPQPDADGENQPSNQVSEQAHQQTFQEPLLTGKLLLLTDEKVKNADFFSFLSGVQEQFNFEIELKTELASGEQADLSLLPYDQLNLEGQPLQFSQDLKPYFLTGLSEILNQSGFIPYAIDPLLFYTLAKNQEKADLINDFQDRTPTKPSASFLFGPHSAPALKSQNLAFALILRDFVKYNDYGAFEQWLEMLASPELRKASYDAFSKFPECKNQPLFCLMRKGFLEWGVGFASELREQKDFSLFPYAYHYEGVPVRVYGFSLNPKSPYRPRAEKLIGAYLTLPDEKVQKMMQKSGFSSVFSSLAEFGCEEVCDFSQGISVIEQSEQKIEALFADFLFKKLEAKKLKPDLYLQRASVY